MLHHEPCARETLECELADLFTSDANQPCDSSSSIQSDAVTRLCPTIQTPSVMNTRGSVYLTASMAFKDPSPWKFNNHYIVRIVSPKTKTDVLMLIYRGSGSSSMNPHLAPPCLYTGPQQTNQTLREPSVFFMVLVTTVAAAESCWLQSSTTTQNPAHRTFN